MRLEIRAEQDLGPAAAERVLQRDPAVDGLRVPGPFSLQERTVGQGSCPVRGTVQAGQHAPAGGIQAVSALRAAGHGDRGAGFAARREMRPAAFGDVSVKDNGCAVPGKRRVILRRTVAGVTDLSAAAREHAAGFASGGHRSGSGHVRAVPGPQAGGPAFALQGETDILQRPGPAVEIQRAVHGRRPAF